MSDVFDYYKSSYAMQAADYPYNSAFPMVGDECKYDEKKATTCEVDDYTYADSGDISMMKLALSHQPIAAALDASMISFQSYSSGILDDDHHCSKTALNHSVLLIGYGHDYDGPGPRVMPDDDQPRFNLEEVPRALRRDYTVERPLTCSVT